MTTLIDRLFIDHPKSVNETYLQHLAAAMGFATRLLLAGFVCAIHALLPFLFEKTASNAIRKLYSRMVTNRVRKTDDAAPFTAETEGLNQA
jgi:hypothetical protein